MIQRISAVLLALYSVGIISFLITHPNLDFESWNALHETQSVRVFSLLTLLGLCAHMWIGMWTVITDYLTPLHLGATSNTVKGLSQIVIITLIIFYAIWGTFVFWSI